MSRALGLGLVGLALCALAGCATENNRPPPPPEARPTPWAEAGAPNILANLALDLTNFQATAGRLPDTLARLDQLGSGADYGSHAFAYHPAGLGLLPGGWSVIAVDDQLRQPDAVWCVVRLTRNQVADLRAVLVPLTDLRISAAKATGGH